MGRVQGRRVDILWRKLLTVIGEKGAAESELGCAMAVGHEAEVADTVEPIRQGVKEEAANELMGHHLKTDGIATIVGKVGYAWDQWLVYGKGGWADLKVSTHTFTPASGVFSDTSGWVSGYTLGAGVDYMLLRNVILGVDFNYYRASTDRATTFSNGAAVTFTGINENIYAVTARASYLFGIP